MKKFFAIFLLMFAVFFINNCSKKDNNGISQMHWDRDMCERCKMAISERKFAVEIINPKNSKAYKFDDIGCAILWMSEEKIPWKDSAKIWITDAKSGKWIDAKEALYTDDSITPMAYGFAAYTKETLPKNHHILKFDEVTKKIFEIEKLNSQKVGKQ